MLQRHLAGGGFLISEVLIFGDDQRMELAGLVLKQTGFSVCFAGMDGWKGFAAKADAVLLPYPWSVKKGTIPGRAGESWPEALETLRPGTVIVAGRGMEPFSDILKSKQLKLRLYEDDPAFLQRNADISAEAAVSELMKRSGKMLDEQNILLMGYGLFAKAIGWRLRMLGARVWVAARRERQRLEATHDGFCAVDTGNLSSILTGMDVVLNTIPSVLISTKELRLLPDHAMLLELASPPYGIDLAAAVALERNVTVLPGLPAAYAPQSAAKALADAAVRLLKEMSV